MCIILTYLGICHRCHLTESSLCTLYSLLSSRFSLTDFCESCMCVGVVSQYPIMESLQFDAKGIARLERGTNTDSTCHLSVEVAEVKSRDPGDAAVRKAVTQLLKRLYLIAYAADACEAATSGHCCGLLLTTVSGDEAREVIKESIEAAKAGSAPWRNAALMGNYSFDVDVRA